MLLFLFGFVIGNVINNWYYRELLKVIYVLIVFELGVKLSRVVVGNL